MVTVERGCSRFVKLCCFDFLYSVRRTTSRRPFPRLIHKLGQNELSVYRASIKALSETYSPPAGSFSHRCNVKNDAFTALGMPAVISALRWALYASGALVVSHVSNIYAYAKVKQIPERGFWAFNFKIELTHMELSYTPWISVFPEYFIPSHTYVVS